MLGWWVRSEVGLGLFYWCNSRDVPQIGTMVFCNGNNVINPVPIKELSSTSLSKNQAQQVQSNQEKKIFYLTETSSYFPIGKGTYKISYNFFLAVDRLTCTGCFS